MIKHPNVTIPFRAPGGKDQLMTQWPDLPRPAVDESMTPFLSRRSGLVRERGGVVLRELLKGNGLVAGDLLHGVCDLGCLAVAVESLQIEHEIGRASCRERV